MRRTGWTSSVLQKVFSSSTRTFLSVVTNPRELHCHPPEERCSELLLLQIMRIIQWNCADTARSSSFRIVAFGNGVIAFPISVISFLWLWHRCECPLEPGIPVSPRVLSTRDVAPLSQLPCVRRLPSSVTRGVELVLPECCKLISCLLSALGKFSLHFTVLLGQTVPAPT